MYPSEYTCEQSETSETITKNTAARPSTVIPTSSWNGPIEKYGMFAW